MSWCICGHLSSSHNYSGCYTAMGFCPCELPFGVQPADGTQQAWYRERNAPAYQAPDLRVFAHLAAAVRDAWDRNPGMARFALLELD